MSKYVLRVYFRYVATKRSAMGAWFVTSCIQPFVRDLSYKVGTLFVSCGEVHGAYPGVSACLRFFSKYRHSWHDARP